MEKEILPPLEERTLNGLIAIYESIENNEGVVSITDIVREYKSSSRLLTALKEFGIITKLGSVGKRNIYQWNSIRPNVHMAKRVIAEARKINNSYYEPKKKKDTKEEVLSEPTTDTTPSTIPTVGSVTIIDDTVVGERLEIGDVRTEWKAPPSERTLLERIVLAFPDHSLNDIKKAISEV